MQACLSVSLLSLLGGSWRLFCGHVLLVASFVWEKLHGVWIAFWCVASHTLPIRVLCVGCAVCRSCMGVQE